MFIFYIRLCFNYILITLFFMVICFFFFNDTATTEIYTLSLHDALPICREVHHKLSCDRLQEPAFVTERSEEHTSELQSHHDLVCRLLLEKKKTHTYLKHTHQTLPKPTTEQTTTSNL